MATAIPSFIRIVTREDQVISINLNQVASFEIKLEEEFKPKEGDAFKAAVLRFFYHATDKHVTFIVGKHITEAEFEYVCETLQELTFRNAAEREAFKQSEVQAKIKAFENTKAE